MQLKSLKVFCDVVGWRSFSRAADENGISQSGASQVVHQLEQTAGRQADRPLEAAVRAHARGRGLLRRLPQAGARYDALEDQVRTLHEEVAGRVRVVSIYSVGLHHMNRYLQQFLSQYPKANVRLEYLHPHRVYEAVENDHADMGLVSYPRASRHGRSHPLARRADGAGLLAEPSPGRPRQRVDSRSWHGENLIGFDSDLTIRREIDRVLQLHDVEVRVVMEFDNIETIKRAIEIDAGVACCPSPRVARSRMRARWWPCRWRPTSWCDRWASSIAAARN